MRALAAAVLRALALPAAAGPRCLCGFGDEPVSVLAQERVFLSFKLAGTLSCIPAFQCRITEVTGTDGHSVFSGHPRCLSLECAGPIVGSLVQMAFFDLLKVE